MTEINPNEVYTTGETKEFLKVSSSTMKRMLKRGLIRASKLGGQYRILGKEILRVISPTIERGAVSRYQNIKKRIKSATRGW
ncbi:MAG: helix-turn-helix domain-containing protein [Candidatus Yanofskybacteria bacterium]|nr:helix-turn-helix domain-containing protein [Candidatus Yanofskybacteria bacterium]